MSASDTPIRAVVFDAYGTLFDVHSLVGVADELFPGRGDTLSQVWRQKQLQYSWLRAMSGRYKPFHEVTRDALRFAAAQLALPLAPSIEDRLMEQYAHLATFSDCLPALRELDAAGLGLAILSNGNRDMLEASVRSAGMTELFDHLLSSESVGTFKTIERIYALAPAAFGCAAREILFVSSNGWDAIAAHWNGFTSFWVNRTGAPLEQLDTVPDHVGTTLADVVATARAARR